jgi:predicted polyphosphate/ATP-dependent NAD kinase
VKIHSGVFARNPVLAGDLARQFLQGRSIQTREVEVMDVDEEAFRDDALAAKLFGYLKTPYERRMLQGVKSGSAPNEAISQNGIALSVVEHMQDGIFYILGPGTTTRAITRALGLRKTLLGVDVVKERALVAEDVNETRLLNLVSGISSKIVITPIGGQGFLFGRGNQQISPEVIRKVGLDNMIVISTTEKINSLQGRPLLVDTGDQGLDEQLSGYTRVITGYNESVIYKLSS